MLAFNLDRQQPDPRRESEAAPAEWAATMLQPVDMLSGRRASQRCREVRRVVPISVVLTLCGMVSAARPVLAQPRVGETAIEFSILPQPLASALGRYGDVTGNEALYEGGLTDGRVSRGVTGRLTPTDALDRLLTGTGLSARFIAEGTFVLAPVRPQSQPTQALSQADRHYYALIQDSVLDALCRLPDMRPGDYRLVVAFWIAPDGVVEDMLRVGTSGRAGVDEQVDRTLRSLHFKESPPAGFAQPVRLLFVPRGPGVRSGCTTVDARLRTHGKKP
ncbi:secretin and TonB N-terminal domain-containing protein [Microbacteriaceae bacterium K1510]|nr:secretin and TonB N-terminal domain-containing protein [Microbacteriaceae bacterium K1510]